MRHYSILCLLLILLLSSMSCTKETESDIEEYPIYTEYVNLSVVSGEVLYFDLGAFGDEDDAQQIRRPSHASTNKAFRYGNGCCVMYEYRSLPGYTGIDRVTWRIGRNYGAGYSHFEDVKLTINVTHR